MKELRKVSDIWKAIDDKRILSKMGKHKWRQSFEGVKAAIEYIGLIMVTTKEEFDKLEIPINRTLDKQYNYRKIEVSKNDILSKSRISDLLSNNNSLKTAEEMKVIYKKLGVNQSLYQPKGMILYINSESKAINDLDALIGLPNYVHRVHLYECRLFDMAYCMINNDINEEVFTAEQVKNARIRENGQVNFHESSSNMLTVKTMISILKNGSLTCIGKNQDDKPSVVWFLYGIDTINILKEFNDTQTFTPRLNLMRKSNNKFTIAMNDTMFRFDVEKSSEECNRLLERKLEFIKNGIKHSLQFLNEDDSQIPCENQRIEQRSLNMTRTACNTISIKVEKRHEYSYGPIDFIVNENVKVQDKVGTVHFNVRCRGRYPYNPDDIDIFQVSDLVNNIVYAIPMRIINNDITISFFNTKQLMKNTVYFNNNWKETHKQFEHDFKTKEGVISYVKACEEASKIPQLTDINFYTNMIDENKDKFGSIKQLAERKLNV